jgi:hypothetical protein
MPVDTSATVPSSIPTAATIGPPSSTAAEVASRCGSASDVPHAPTSLASCLARIVLIGNDDGDAEEEEEAVAVAVAAAADVTSTTVGPVASRLASSSQHRSVPAKSRETTTRFPASLSWPVYLRTTDTLVHPSEDDDNAVAAIGR